MPEMKTLTVNGVTYDLRDPTKAPAGYGLGEADGRSAPTDLNEATTIGFYRLAGVDTVNYPTFNSSFRYGTLLVERRGNLIHQTIRYGNDAAVRWRDRDTLEWSAWVNCGPAAFAPAGYGLGENSSRWVDNPDTALQSGWYRTETPYSGWMRVDAYATTHLTQTLYLDSYAGCAIQRTRQASAFGEWEWVNPPMAVGVEYRTTERWQSKVVYTKLINFGTLPNTTFRTLSHGISVENIIEAHGSTSDGNYFPSNYANSTVGDIDLFVTTTTIAVTTHGDYSSVGAYILLKYTKK